MLNIVMLVKDRPRLTRQALESLVENTRGPFNLTVMDDHSQSETKGVLADFAHAMFGRDVLIADTEPTGPGPARNVAINVSDYTFGRPGLLYLCDNDMYALPGWDTALLTAWSLAKAAGFKALGGYCHAYQKSIRRFGNVNELAALGLLSWLMEWETWDEHGPFEPSATINGSEDWLMSQKIRKASGMVGVLDPAVVVNCGATSSDGKPCPGAALLYQQKIPPGVAIE